MALSAMTYLEIAIPKMTIKYSINTIQTQIKAHNIKRDVTSWFRHVSLSSEACIVRLFPFVDDFKSPHVSVFVC